MPDHRFGRFDSRIHTINIRVKCVSELDHKAEDIRRLHGSIRWNVVFSIFDAGIECSMPRLKRNPHQRTISSGPRVEDVGFDAHVIRVSAMFSPPAVLPGRARPWFCILKNRSNSC